MLYNKTSCVLPQMVSRPQQFDVVVLPNLYGNIITNISTALVGGAGLVAGVNINDAMAVFETVSDEFLLTYTFIIHVR